jgi:hypothetical protein
MNIFACKPTRINGLLLALVGKQYNAACVAVMLPLIREHSPFSFCYIYAL